MGLFTKKERRDYKRVSKELVVKFHQKKGETPLKSYSKNISGSGILLEATKNIPKNTVMYVTLNLPKYGEVILEAQVVRSVKQGATYQIGLAFFNIDKENQQIILDAIS